MARKLIINGGAIRPTGLLFYLMFYSCFLMLDLFSKLKKKDIYIYIYIYIYTIVVLASEPVGGRSRAIELPCF